MVLILFGPVQNSFPIMCLGSFSKLLGQYNVSVNEFEF